MNTIKLNVIGELTSSAEGGSGEGGGNTPSGEGVATIDLSSIGYDADDAKFVQDKAKADIAYSKTLYDAWDASKTSTYHLYYMDRKMVYVPNIDTSKVTDMSQMFINSSTFTTIPQLDTSNVTNMSQMFYSCSALTTIPQLNTSKVTSMTYMFYGCSALTTIPQLDTSNVTEMKQMFNNCSALTTIPQLNTSKVTDMERMFYGCSALTTIPQLDTSNVTNMSQMFDGCLALTTIPQLDTSKVTSMGRMFNNCSALENLGGLVNCKVALDLSDSNKLTHQSLMNVINNLYDLTANGLSGQTLTLGSTNIAKLTADEIAIATNKGWTIK